MRYNLETMLPLGAFEHCGNRHIKLYGGGGSWNSTSSDFATGGTGGGGNGAGGAAIGTVNVATAGTTNRGGGGGGGGYDSTGANGGSGIVILRYADTKADLTSIGGGLTYSLTTTGGYKIYTFTAGTGSVTV
jgi:hypothetical protein